MPVIRKILIANRGEIAVRVARSAREMGIRPVMVYSDADLGAAHTRHGDEAAAIGPSYLAIERIIEAARVSGADAIHPGYGFLSENSDFAEACRSAGIIFVGPTPEAIRMMGLKTAAREIAVSACVPVVPAYESGAQIEYPVLIKASAGGGGRGMRIVKGPGELEAALESARGEAERAFGDGSLLLEQYIQDARHIEFQIFGDHHGNVIHLFERDCSLQRRYQKLIEESPSPALSEELRHAMGDAAVAIGRAIGYTNAGTVEFLLAPSGEFYFIEVNTRLQVEHPVTELVTGIDLVRLQIEIAEGKRLPAHPRSIGHAIEARLNAEDPLNGFLPSAGTVRVWRGPENVRVDTALETGAEVGIQYDSLVAKVVSYAGDRESARRKLIYALRNMVLFGVETNRDYLIQLLESEEFRGGRAHTGFLPAPESMRDVDDHVVAGVLYLNRSPVQGIPAGYRNNPCREPFLEVRVRGEQLRVSWRLLESGRLDVSCGNGVHTSVNAARTSACATINSSNINSPGTKTSITTNNCSGRITLDVTGITRTYEIYEYGELIFVHSPRGAVTLQRVSRFPRRAASGHQAANSPMPGQVLRILVREGQLVKAGDSLVVLEAMKMEQTVRTTINGVVESIVVEIGQVVAPGQRLVEIAAQENS